MEPNSIHPSENSQELNINVYTNKKIIAKGMLDLTLITNNVVQLKEVIKAGSGGYFYGPLIVLIPLSLILQVTVGLILIVDGTTNINQQKKHRKANVMNNVSTGLILVTCVLNIIISVFYGEHLQLVT